MKDWRNISCTGSVLFTTNSEHWLLPFFSGLSLYLTVHFFCVFVQTFVVLLLYALSMAKSKFDSCILPNLDAIVEMAKKGAMDKDIAKALNVAKSTFFQYLANLLKYSVIVVATAPLMILYPFIQKHFVKGVMLGSIKG